MKLTVGSCQNGDMSQLFAATYKDADGSQKENLMPLFWATSAYVGNGVMGLRVQAESAADGVFQLLVSSAVVPHIAGLIALACKHIFYRQPRLCSFVGSSTTTTLVEQVTGWLQATIVCTLTRCSLRCLSMQRSNSGCSMEFLWPMSQTRLELQSAAFQRL